MDTVINVLHAYYSVPIFEGDQKLLEFKFRDILYQFLALPNGYTKGPQKCIKLLKPILAKLRKQGITYLDDIFVLAWTYELCKSSVLKVLEELRLYGFVINYKKSVLEPSTVIEFLGFIFDSIAI